MDPEWRLRLVGCVQLLALAMFAAWGLSHAVTDTSANWRWFYATFTFLMTAGWIYRMIRYRQRFKPLF